MTKEVLNGLTSLYKDSGNGTIEHTSEGVKITGNAWVNQISEKGVNGDYIEIDPNATFYYDIVYSNKTAGNLFYIGFERFDANKTATSNSSTVYVVSNSTAADNVRVVGTVDLSKDSANHTTKYIRLRILNNWTNSTASNGILEIKLLSLLQGQASKTDIQKTGILESGFFRENNFQDARIFKNEGIEGNQFIEI